MNYFTALATDSPSYEIPYSGHQIQSIPFHNNDLSALLTNNQLPINDVIYNQQPTLTFQCTPQINYKLGSSPSVYHVPENMPIDMILQQLGIDTDTLQRASSFNVQNRSSFQPMYTTGVHPTGRRRRLVCQEVSDSEDDYSHMIHQRSPGPIHNLLRKVWSTGSDRSNSLQPAASAPNLSHTWETMKNNSPYPTNFSAQHAWQAIQNSRNLPPPPPPPPPPSNPPFNQSPVNKVWQGASHAYDQNPNYSPNMPYNTQQPPSISPYNQQAVARTWQGASHANDQNANHFSNTSYNMQPPSQNPAVMNTFFAARNAPPYTNQPNPAVGNVWSRAEHSAQNQPPPMINIPWNRMSQEASSPQNPMWNNMPPNQQYSPNPAWNNAPQNQQYSPNPAWNNAPQNQQYPRSPIPPYQSPMSGQLAPPMRTGAPLSFGSILAQAHRQHIPYTGAI